MKKILILGLILGLIVLGLCKHVEYFSDHPSSARCYMSYLRGLDKPSREKRTPFCPFNTTHKALHQGDEDECDAEDRPADLH